MITEPATVPLATAPPEPVTERLAVPVPASWLRRVGAHLIDVVLPCALVFALLVVAVRARDLTAALAVLALGSLVLLLFGVWNSAWRQGRTGATVGKTVVGIRLVGAGTGRPVGFGRALARLLAHLVLDALPFLLGYLWPLWDERRQTFADKACSTVVVRVGTGDDRSP